MKKPRVSIITPCYKDGNYLPDAVESARESVESGYCEHIIVDDGSDDKETLDYYKTLDPEKVKVIFAGKVGLGKARNIGIAAARCHYYLNLDADNKIRPAYPIKAAEILDKHPEAGVVYSNLKYFGTRHDEIHVGGFDACKLLASNYIDSCAIIRRQTWKDAGGYDEHEMLWEDWNFWHSVMKTRWQFFYLDETLFEYRVRNEGSLRLTANERGVEVENYIAQKHGSLYREKFMEHHQTLSAMGDNPLVLVEEIQQLKNDLQSMHNSESWKLTEPLRWLCKLLHIS